jgi:signal transduction histidine kinase/CheY-like chemotaxis protein
MSYLSEILTVHIFRLLFLILIGFVVNLSASADTPQQLTIDLSNGKQTLDAGLLYLLENDQSYRLEQVLDESNSEELGWKSGHELDQTRLMKPGFYWIKSSLFNPFDHEVTLTIMTEYPIINSATLYSVAPDQTLKTLFSHAGSNHPFKNRPTPHRNLITKLSLPAKSVSTLLWHIESKPIFQFRASLWEPDEFIAHDQQEQMLYGMLYGILIVMALYNFFLYFSTKQKGYIYYVLYVLSSLYLMAAGQGHIYQYFSPDSAWPKFQVYILTYAFSTFMFSQFCVYFLNLKKHSRLLLKFIRWIVASILILAILFIFYDIQLLILIGLVATALLYASALIAGIIVRRAGVISAGHFIIAIMILVFSLAADAMATLKLIENNALTENLGAFGSVLMLIFFSLALADLINQLQKESRENRLGMAKADEEKIKSRSELHKSQQDRIKLEQTASQVKMESRSKSRFLATMSKEIRTPINKISANAAKLKATPLNQQQSQFLESVEDANNSLFNIINDLQDFSKIEAGEMELEPSNFNLETLVDGCISSFAQRAAEKEIELTASIESGLPAILKGDGLKLRQIIINLLSNAVKFTQQGSVVLNVSDTGKQAINCIELKFSINDTGIGLSNDDKQRLFTPFHHAETYTYEQFGGSGLGLSICKQLAELMDGTIGVESEPGKGSNFWFTARLLVDEHADNTLLLEKSDILTGKKLLLVDANTASNDILLRLLKSWKLDVVSCDNVHDAIEQLTLSQDQLAFDFVLADYYLQDEDSLAISRYLKQQQQPTAMILMMASRNIKHHTSLINEDIGLVLEKPVTNALLHEALVKVVTSNDDGNNNTTK